MHSRRGSSGGGGGSAGNGNGNGNSNGNGHANGHGHGNGHGYGHEQGHGNGGGSGSDNDEDDDTDDGEDEGRIEEDDSEGGDEHNEDEQQQDCPGSDGALAISGTPAGEVTAGEYYLFRPATSNPAELTLVFTVSGQPSWAIFDELTGDLFGWPQDADVGLSSSIEISVSDGSSEVSLAPFSIEVLADGAAVGSVTLNWAPPTENEDGSQLTNLAGYWIYWGNLPGTYTESMKIDNPGLSRIVIDNLTPGTYEFVATSFNAAGVESRFSNAITTVVQ